MSNATAVLEVQTVTVERLEPELSGSTKGRPWTRYRVHGTDEHGHPLPLCKTFDALPIGPVKVIYEPFIKDGVRQSWTLKPVEKPSRNFPAGTGTLEERVAELESEVADLRRKLNAIFAGLRED